MSSDDTDSSASLQGRFLVASRLLRDPNFAHTVVLLVQHSDSGALGLVINRPLDLTVRHACAEALESDYPVDGHLHQGGPCEGVLMVLHNRKDMAEIEVKSGVYFSTARDKIEWLLQHHEGPAKYFVGYSGWTAGQLEAEIEVGSWVIADSAIEPIFEEEDEAYWQKLMTKLTMGRWMDPGAMPEDPSVN